MSRVASSDENIEKAKMVTQQYSNASIVVRIATRAPPLEHPNTDAFLTMVEITAQKACAITQVVSMLFGIGASPRASVRHISFARHFRIRFFRAFSYAPPPLLSAKACSSSPRR